MSSSRTDSTEKKLLPSHVLLRLCVTLGIGALGGWLLSKFQFPLAWMLGSMSIITVCALSGLPILQQPVRLRVIMLAVLGVMLGSGFSPEVMDRVDEWAGTLSVMTLFVGVITVIGLWGLRRFMGFDGTTAYFSSVPGGLTDMAIVGGEQGGDDRAIALIHSLRILLTVLTIPLWFRLVEDVIPSPVISESAGLSAIGIKDAAILLGLGLFGAIAGRLLRLPAYPMFGAMLFSAIAHLSGYTDAKPPTLIVNAAQVVMGTAIGCRFIDTDIRRVPGVMLAGCLTAIYMLVAAAILAFFLEPCTGTSFAALWLAFAPGGLAEMALISIALGADPAFVATHHLYRVTFLIIAAPLAFKLGRRWLRRHQR